MKVCFETLGLPSPREAPLYNEKYCNVISDTETPIFSVDDDQLILHKTYNTKSLTDNEVLFNDRLSRKRRVTENIIGTETNRAKIIAKRYNLIPDKASVVVLPTLALHNLLRFKPRNSYTPKRT